MNIDQQEKQKKETKKDYNIEGIPFLMSYIYFVFYQNLIFSQNLSVNFAQSIRCGLTGSHMYPAPVSCWHGCVRKNKELRNLA